MFSNVSSEHNFPFSFFHEVVDLPCCSSFMVLYERFIYLMFTASLSSFHSLVITVWPCLAVCYSVLGCLIRNG